jgi:flagellar biosynthesis protein FlhB
VSDVSEKPFEATPHRILKAKRDGNVARASELGANLSFAAAGLALVTAAPLFGAVACNALRGSWSGAPAALDPVLVAVGLIPIAAAAGAGALGYALQSGGITVTAVEPKLERLDPMQGLKRSLSL